MSARKWPIYSMSVGNVFFIANLTQTLRRNLHQRAADRGLQLSIRKAVHDNLMYVMRVA